jgi:hypothetical protein
MEPIPTKIHTALCLPTLKCHPKSVDMNLRMYIAYDRIDTGQDIHVRVHKGINIELTVSFANWEESLVDAKVVFKVQHPSRVGGT